MLVNQLDTEDRNVSMLVLPVLTSACSIFRVDCWPRLGSVLGALVREEMCEGAEFKPAA